MNTLAPITLPSDVSAPKFQLFQTVNHCDEETGRPAAGIIVGMKFTSLLEALGEGLMLEGNDLLPTLCLGWKYTLSKYHASTPEEILNYCHECRWLVEDFHESQLSRVN